MLEFVLGLLVGAIIGVVLMCLLQVNKKPELPVPVSDELLWQEIFSLREKLKLSVEAIKSYDPGFDDQLFLHQLNSVDYEQMMEELSEPRG